MRSVIIQCLIIAISVSSVSYFFSEKEAFEKIPKERRIEGMAEQEFELTRDIATNSIPRQQIFKIKEQIQNNMYRSGTSISWEERGPDNFGGRTRTMAFDPSDPSGNTIWTGGIAGGLWKLTNAFSNNYTWEIVKSYDGNSAISSIVIDPSNHDVIYVSTGEGWFNADAYKGDGIYRSLDGGKSWRRLESTSDDIFDYVQKLLISGDRLFACTRAGGLQMSLDRGETWVKSIGNGQFGFSERTGDIDLASDGTLYVCMGFSGSSDGVYSSKDNGDTWNYMNIPGYLPRRIELAVSPSNPEVIYVLKEASTRSIEEIAKTENGGLSWTLLESPPALGMDFFSRNQAWYDLSITIDPNDEDRVFIGGVDILLTEDGGENWEQMSQWYGGAGFQEVHADQHFAGYLKGSNTKAAFTNDGGLFLTSNATASVPDIRWKNQGYNTIQFYACAIHPIEENYFLAGTQDNGTHLFTDSGVNSTWEVTGGDGAYCHIDRDNPDIQISSYVYNNYWVTTNSWSSRERHNISDKGYFINPTDYDDDNDYLICSSQQEELLIMDVHTGEFDSIKFSQINGQRVTAIKVHPADNTKVYIGTNGGKVFEIDSLVQGSPRINELFSGGGNVRSIDVDLNNPDRLLFCISNTNLENVFVSNDAGLTWENHDGDLPKMPIRWAVFNPANPNGVLVGTELGIWTTNAIAGVTDTEWSYNSFGLPPTRVDMLDVRASDFTVIAATHGRGLFSAKLCTGAIDNDNDGFSCDDDCNDFDENINSGVSEIAYNGIDDDCNPATPDDDIDQDGYTLAFDCDDQDASINPDADEVAGNGIDENCDGLDEEAPCDSFYTGPWDILASAGNCINGPTNSTWEIWSNESYFVKDLREGITYYFDFCEGYDATVFPANVSIYYYNSNNTERGSMLTSLDSCRIEFEYIKDDNFPDILMILHDMDDCNSASDMSGNGLVTFGCLSSGIDLDMDGFTDEIDCDDTNAEVNPGAAENYYNGLDDDCNSDTVDDDQDGDGFGLDEDCDDLNALINPSATEIIFNGIDDDCDPSTLDNDIDGDGYGLDVDCDESNPDINPGATEIPGNGIDEDCDGLDGPSAVYELGTASLNIYPNPSSGFVYLDSDRDLRLSIEVYTETGKIVLKESEVEHIDLSSFENGVYVLRVTDIDTKKSVVEKLVLIK